GLRPKELRIQARLRWGPINTCATAAITALSVTPVRLVGGSALLRQDGIAAQIGIPIQVFNEAMYVALRVAADRSVASRMHHPAIASCFVVMINYQHGSQFATEGAHACCRRAW